MKVECIKPFGLCVPGDVAEVPDGSLVSLEFWRPAEDPVPPLAAAAVPGLPFATPVKEGM